MVGVVTGAGVRSSFGAGSDETRAAAAGEELPFASKRLTSSAARVAPQPIGRSSEKATLRICGSRLVTDCATALDGEPASTGALKLSPTPDVTATSSDRSRSDPSRGCRSRRKTPEGNRRLKSDQPAAAHAKRDNLRSRPDE
jgi:hypothetical protein